MYRVIDWVLFGSHWSRGHVLIPSQRGEYPILPDAAQDLVLVLGLLIVFTVRTERYTSEVGTCFRVIIESG